MKIPCIQWRCRTNFTAPSCARQMSESRRIRGTHSGRPKLDAGCFMVAAVGAGRLIGSVSSTKKRSHALLSIYCCMTLAAFESLEPGMHSIWTCWDPGLRCFVSLWQDLHCTLEILESRRWHHYSYTCTEKWCRFSYFSSISPVLLLRTKMMKLSSITGDPFLVSECCWFSPIFGVCIFYSLFQNSGPLVFWV